MLNAMSDSKNITCDLFSPNAMLKRYFVTTCPGNDNCLGQQLKNNIRVKHLIRSSEAKNLTSGIILVARIVHPN